MALLPHPGQTIEPLTRCWQCSQKIRLSLVRFLHSSFGSNWTPAEGVFSHHAKPPRLVIGPPQSRQKRDPAFTALFVAMEERRRYYRRHAERSFNTARPVMPSLSRSKTSSPSLTLFGTGQSCKTRTIPRYHLEFRLNIGRYIIN